MSNNDPNEQANRDLAEQRLNMGKDPGGSYGDLNQKYENQQNNSSNGGGGGCFPRGTKIDTPTGKKDITNLKEGDYVLSFDTDSGEICPRRILKFKSHSNNKIWLVRFEDGTCIKTTAIHSFNIQGKWKKASNIQSGDLLTSFDSSKGFINRSVKTSHLTEEVEEVYNIIVHGNYNFIADGAIAHSFTYFKFIKKTIWSIYSSILVVKKNRSLVCAMRTT